MTAILEDLRARGLIEQMTNEAEIARRFGAGGESIYVGFDPTARSLHVGSLLPILVLARLQRAGIRPIVVVGGATGMIGDPSGRSSERNLITAELVDENSRGIRSQLERFVSFEGEAGAVFVNNADWTTPVSYIDFLRDVGKHFSVNAMIAKESVRRRLEDREQGISYTEFSYMLLQAFDFLVLFERYGCRFQGGGSDQWGNITAGTDLIRRKHGEEAFGITFPLVTTSSGEKFGKSAGNAIWLDGAMTSPYRFYQYWIRTEDADVARFLGYFTFLSREEIAELGAAHAARPEAREGQKRLAAEVTRLVHGAEGLARAERATAILFGGDPRGLAESDLLDIFADVPASEFPLEELAAAPALVDVLVRTGVCKSKGDARRNLEAGAVYVNGERAVADRLVGTGDLLGPSTLLLRLGRKAWTLVRVR